MGEDQPADQPVELAAHDPGWAGRFVEQRDRVGDILGDLLAGAVEHVGSTAVADLPAKPVVDLLAPVHDLDAARGAVAALAGDGWLYWPQDPAGHYRLWFLRPHPAARTHHLHVIAHDDPQARALLAFRDALRADADLRGRYARLKRRLGEAYRDNRNAYTNAKGAFVEEALRGVGVDPPPRVLLPE
ncbi:GrpB family protein [Frankia sp. AiPs1]|uniref:GrpB family protein n=1 Tax=Frankia sp. AiPs1 TaxID=573493 RepID=UPI00204422A5|nr:GrpB family protein [Frankia sp. AiPs1]MCM3923274.1 GrpB family protein [Frankia sp. AiPs1]